MPITVQDLRGQEWQYEAHYNMGPKGYGYGYRCIRYPRLSFIDRTFKPSREHPDWLNTRTWYVDDAEMVSIDAAAEALNVLPKLSTDEARVLDLTDMQARALRIADNSIALNSTWNEEMRVELADLKFADYPLEPLGFD